MDYIVGYLFFIPVMATGVWVIRSTRADLKKYGASPKWWRWYTALLFLGLAIGAVLAFKGYLRLPEMILRGMPVPLYFERFTDGEWVVNKPPILVQFGAFISNVLVGATALVLPLKVAALIKHFQKAVAPEP